MLLLIPLLPFAGFLVNAGLGRRIAKTRSGGVACGAMLAAFGVALAAVWQLVALEPQSRQISQRVFDWIRSGTFDVSLTLRLDPLSAIMILIVTGIGALIHIYSTAYMHEESDAEYARYFSYLNLFAAFMLLLVLAANFLVLFVGWEGVGLCSYLLIGFWFRKRSAADAGKKAFIVNRIGDFGFLLGMLVLTRRFGTLDFQDIARMSASLRPEAHVGTLTLATLLLFLGATGKSAQIPLFVWLPDAMEGPTPVSALIHAATMVTAGVYMIGRNAVLFSRAPETLTVVAIVGTATALVAAAIALVQNDIKRVLAYSTVSQLGYMVLATGVGAYAAGIFHLFTHAFFKALLFLGAGAVIHALGGEQDLRRMGGLRRELPTTYWTFVVAAAAIAGVPGLAGFFSKDAILYHTFASGHAVLWSVGLVTAVMTATYMFRLVFLAFHGESRRVEPHARLHDAPPAMAIVLIVLAVGSVVAGYAGLPESLGGTDLFSRFLAPVFTTGGTALASGVEESATSSALEVGLMAVSILAAFGGIGLAVYFFLGSRQAADALAARFPGLYRALDRKLYVDEAYDAAIVQPIRIVSEDGLWRGVDARFIDGAVNGVGEAIGGAGTLLRRLQSGSLRVYAATLLFGVVVVVGYYLW
jgi:NADH-quinone oxidoreductase subunit L